MWHNCKLETPSSKAAHLKTQKKKSFTLTLVPDCGIESRTGNVDLRLVAAGFCTLIGVFLLCLCIIVGYHIKLYQEMGYKAAISVMEKHLAAIDKSNTQVETLTEKIGNLQALDSAYRQYASMNVPDQNMYLAGVGGHALVDESRLEGMNRKISGKVRDLLVSVNSIDRRVYLEQASFGDILEIIQHQNDVVRNTPDILPCQTWRISSPFGTRTNPVTGKREFHEAVDFNGVLGDKIFATADGVVTVAEYHPTRGNYIVVTHKYGYETTYAHLNSFLVTVGQEVKKRDVIGTMGRTGRATGVNLHYCVSVNRRIVNPAEYF